MLEHLTRTNMTTPYTPTAIYYDDADTVEYVRRDAPCVHRRVDGFLTLTFDMFNRDQLIGFRLKGFKNFYLKELKPTQKLDLEFVSLALAIEKAVSIIGDGLFDETTKSAYRSAVTMAIEDGATLRELPRRRA